MAAPSTRNVAASKPKVSGGVYFAPKGTTLPTDASTALPAAFVALGYISDDGIKPSRETNIEKIKAWGGDVVAALLGDEESSFEFTLYEVFSTDVAKFVYGADNVNVTPATATEGAKTTVLDKGGKPEQGVLAFEMQHQGKKLRVLVPVADPNVTEEGPWKDDELMSYTVQVEALKDSSGVRTYRYYQDDNKAA